MSSREDRIRELEKEIERIRQEIAEESPWTVTVRPGSDEYYFEDGIVELDIPGYGEVIMARGSSSYEKNRATEIMEKLSLFPLMVKALKNFRIDDGVRDLLEMLGE